jgi:hypothetical protein
VPVAARSHGGRRRVLHLAGSLRRCRAWRMARAARVSSLSDYSFARSRSVCGRSAGLTAARRRTLFSGSFVTRGRFARISKQDPTVTGVRASSPNHPVPIEETCFLRWTDAQEFGHYLSCSYFLQHCFWASVFVQELNQGYLQFTFGRTRQVC